VTERLTEAEEVDERRVIRDTSGREAWLPFLLIHCEDGEEVACSLSRRVEHSGKVPLRGPALVALISFAHWIVHNLNDSHGVGNEVDEESDASCILLRLVRGRPMMDGER